MDKYMNQIESFWHVTQQVYKIKKKFKKIQKIQKLTRGV